MPTLEQLIDLEVALAADRELPLELLQPRDARIAREIGAASLDGEPLYLAWLERMRDPEHSAGRRFNTFLRALGAVLVALGALSGAGAIAGWLWTASRLPVNVVQLWPAVVGLQIALLLGWIAARGLARLAGQGPGAGLSTLLPEALGAFLSRRADATLRAAIARVRELDWLYGRLRFWRSVALTQAFAIAFNAGALAALTLIPTVDDPAFGWRSRLVDARSVHRAARAASLPWRGLWPDAVPSLQTVEATLHSRGGPAPPVAKGRGDDVWAAWWPFLVASLLCYGLLPRAALWVLARVRTAFLLRSVQLDHTGYRRLRERLHRTAVETRGTGDEAAAPLGPEHVPALAPGDLPAGEIALLCCAGVPLPDAALQERVAACFGAAAPAVTRVADLDPAGDANALARIRESGARAAILVVEGWEPPTGDYLDLLRALRGALGDGAPIVVAPCQVDETGALATLEPSPSSLWRRRLVQIGDPWLRVEPLTPADSR